jgi:hypothetical protein
MTTDRVMSTLDDEKVERLEGMLRRALTDLQVVVGGAGAAGEGFNDISIRRSARFVFESMSTRQRCYHGVDHVFQVADNARRLQMQQQEEEDQNRDCGGVGGAPAARSSDTNEEDAILALAAIFHDVIYLSLEEKGRLSRDQREVLNPHVLLEQHPNESDNGVLLLQYNEGSESSDELTPDQRQLDLVCRIFDVLDHGSSNIILKQPSPSGGAEGSMSLAPGSSFRSSLYVLNPSASNEFLSALAAVRCVGDALLTPFQTFRLVACIEASIPFRRRPPSPQPASSSATSAGRNDDRDDDAATWLYTTGIMEELFVRWSNASKDLGLGLSDADVVRATQLACRFAHADLGSFASSTVEPFLDSTWSLLPEWFPQLLNLEDVSSAPTTAPSPSDPSPEPKVRSEPSLDSFEEALVGLLQRYPTIDPQYIFPSFRGSYQLWKDRTDAAARNLEWVGQYARVRLAGLRIVKDAAKCLLRIPATLSSSIHLGTELNTLSFLRRVESGVSYEALSDLWAATSNDMQDDVRNDKDREDQQVLWRCLTSTGDDEPRAPCSWGDAVVVHASALVYASVRWNDIVQLSKQPVQLQEDADGGSGPPPGDLVRLLPKPARRLLLDSVVNAAMRSSAGTAANEALLHAIEGLRASLHNSLDCATSLSLQLGLLKYSKRYDV